MLKVRVKMMIYVKKQKKTKLVKGKIIIRKRTRVEKPEYYRIIMIIKDCVPDPRDSSIFSYPWLFFT